MNVIRAFAAGFLTLAVLHVCVTCSEDESGTQPSPQPTVNVEKIHEAAQRIEDAFRSADPEAVLAVMTEQAQERYAGELGDVIDQLPAFADAIRSRQLVGYAEYYAEYSYASEGRSLTFALALQDEDDWKLMRF
ncbi:MAG: hypothetical protein JXA28_10125 [Bacteroidetes bacterium]|nr:hypothetical protein [Bacteroidota bacterium]